MFLTTVLPGLVLLGLVIFVHELGHFIAAKWRGVRVLRFSLGMGPEMIGFTRGETRYALAWVPLGGFVQMAGDSISEDGTMPDGGPDEFLTHPWIGRLVIAVAGPLANLVFAYVAYFALGVTGFRLPDFANVLGRVAPAGAAARAGLAEGDRIVRVGGEPVGSWFEMAEGLMSPDTSRGVALAVERADSSFEVVVAAGEVAALAHALEPPSSPAVVGSILSGLPAYLAGFEEGDQIVAVDGRAIQRFDEISPALVGRAGQPVPFRIRRGADMLDLVVRPASDPSSDTGRAIIGVEPMRGLTREVRYGPLEAARYAALQTASGVAGTYSGLWLTLTRFWSVREQMGGPIYIAQMARDAARKGLDWWLNMLGFINLAIMAFNLLPIPLLDGGHITLALLQAVRGRPVSGRAYLNFQKVGLAVVGTLFVFILAQDVMRPIRRMQAKQQAPSVIESAPRDTASPDSTPSAPATP